MALLTPEFLARLDQLRLITRKRAAGRLPGGRPARRTGSSLELADYREYQPGDDLRYVDWAAYQRLGRLFVKLWVAEQDLVVTLVVDASASMTFGEPSKLARAKQLAAACGYIALTGGDPVQLVVLGPTAGPPPPVLRVRGRAEAVELFRHLERVQAGGQADWARGLASLRSFATPSPGLTFWFSDGCDPQGPVALASALRSLYALGQETLFIQLLSPAELQPEGQGEYRLLDAEGGPSVELTFTRAVLRAYQDELAQWLEAIQASARSLGVDHLLVNSAWPVEQTIWRGLQSVHRLQLRAD